MRDEIINFNCGTLEIEFLGKKEVGNDLKEQARITLILNNDFLKKFICYNLNYRGEEHYRLKDADVIIDFTEK